MGAAAVRVGGVHGVRAAAAAWLVAATACGTTAPHEADSPRPSLPNWTAVPPDEADSPRLPTNDSVGDVVLPDKVVRIVEVDRSALASEGRVGYRVKNVSGREQPDLLWSVAFHLPPEIGAEVTVPRYSERGSEMPLKLVAGGTSERLEATCPNFRRHAEAGVSIVATTFHLGVEVPVLTTPRSADGSPGTHFLGGKLECVGMIQDLHRRTSMWIEFENVSASRIPPFEVQAVFPSTGARTLRRAGAGLSPGERRRVEIDLAGIDVGDSEFFIKVSVRGL